MMMLLTCYQRELSSSLPIIAQNCDAARDKIKRRPQWPAFDDDKLYGLIIITDVACGDIH
jgi:hypothetical protein